MISVLTGDNSFETDRALQRIVAGFDGAAEKVDGSEIELRQLPDLLMGVTLFAPKRLVVIKRLSDNKTLWTDFGDWIGRVSEDVHVVLVEPTLDKRTKTYKALKKSADVHEYKSWTERDYTAAEQWAAKEMTTLGAEIDKKCVQTLVQRVGVDQWALFHALQKLSVLDVVTPDIIADVVEATPAENVFAVFESALRGDVKTLARMIETVSLTEDPYRLFGLLSGQAFQLAVLAVAEKSSAHVASDIKAHPFVLSKLDSHARRCGRAGAARILGAFMEADQAMKTSAAEPWLLIERALMKVAADSQ